VGRNAHQHVVAIVQPGMHQGNYQLLECGGRYISADLTQLTKSGKATFAVKMATVSQRPKMVIRVPFLIPNLVTPKDVATKRGENTYET